MPYSQATVLGTTLAAMVPTTAAAVAQHQRWVVQSGAAACMQCRNWKRQHARCNATQGYQCLRSVAAAVLLLVAAAQN